MRKLLTTRTILADRSQQYALMDHTIIFLFGKCRLCIQTTKQTFWWTPPRYASCTVEAETAFSNLWSEMYACSLDSTRPSRLLLANAYPPIEHCNLLSGGNAKWGTRIVMQLFYLELFMRCSMLTTWPVGDIPCPRS
jgi:hypothetical protein